MSVQSENVRKSTITLGNAAQLVAAIVKRVAGNDVADTLGGSPITNNTLRTLTMSRLKKKLEPQQ
jgi:hypothetical protein